MELGVNHEQNLSSLTTTVVNIFDKYNKKFWYPQDLFQIMAITLKDLHKIRRSMTIEKCN